MDMHQTFTMGVFLGRNNRLNFEDDPDYNSDAGSALWSNYMENTISI